MVLSFFLCFVCQVLVNNVSGTQTVVCGCRGWNGGLFCGAVGGGFSWSREEGDRRETRMDRVLSEY